MAPIRVWVSSRTSTTFVMFNRPLSGERNSGQLEGASEERALPPHVVADVSQRRIIAHNPCVECLPGVESEMRAERQRHARRGIREVLMARDASAPAAF